MAKTIWIHVSLQIFLTRKKKLKLTLINDDYNECYKQLCSLIKVKVLRPFIDPSVELPEISLMYTPETELDGTGTDLRDGDDIEGMLDEYPDGKNFRVIVIINGNFDQWTESFYQEMQSSIVIPTSLSQSMRSQSNSKVSYYLSNQLAASAVDPESGPGSFSQDYSDVSCTRDSSPSPKRPSSKHPERKRLKSEPARRRQTSDPLKKIVLSQTAPFRLSHTEHQEQPLTSAGNQELVTSNTVFGPYANDGHGPSIQAPSIPTEGSALTTTSITSFVHPDQDSSLVDATQSSIVLVDPMQSSLLPDSDSSDPVLEAEEEHELDPTTLDMDVGSDNDIDESYDIINSYNNKSFQIGPLSSDPQYRAFNESHIVEFKSTETVGQDSPPDSDVEVLPSVSDPREEFKNERSRLANEEEANDEDVQDEDNRNNTTEAPSKRTSEPGTLPAGGDTPSPDIIRIEDEGSTEPDGPPGSAKLVETTAHPLGPTNDSGIVTDPKDTEAKDEIVPDPEENYISAEETPSKRKEQTKVKVMMDYTAMNEGEINVKMGDEAILLESDDKHPKHTGWFKVEHNGQVGYVRSSCLVVIPPNNAARDATAPQEDYSSTKETSSKIKKPTKVKVVSDFIAKSEKEISVKKDEEMILLSCDERGWCNVEHNGRVGYVRIENLIVIPPDEEARDVPGTQEDYSSTKETPSKIKKPTKVKVVLDYIAQSEKEISVKMDDEMILLSYDERGWSKVDHNGRVGYVRSENLIIIPPDEEVRDAPDPEGSYIVISAKETPSIRKTPTKVKVVFDYPAGGENEINAKKDDEMLLLGSDENGWSKVDHNGQVGFIRSAYLRTITSDQTVKDYSTSETMPPSNKTKTIKVQAKVDYDAKGEVEISVKKGDEMILLGPFKQGWAKVDHNGKVGMVRSRCLKIIQVDATIDDSNGTNSGKHDENSTLHETKGGRLKMYSEILINSENSDTSLNKATTTTDTPKSTYNYTITSSPSRSLLGPSVANPANRGMLERATSAGKQVLQNVFGSFIGPQTIKLTFIICAPKKESLIINYAVGYLNTKWNVDECETIVKYTNDLNMYRVTIDVPESTGIYYKFSAYKPSQFFHNKSDFEWETLDFQFYQAVHHNNRFVDGIRDDITIYVASRFDKYVRLDGPYTNQYKLILQFITGQSIDVQELCIQLECFVLHTLNDPKTECKKLFRGIFTDFFKTSDDIARKIALLWILPSFPKRVKHGNVKDTLSNDQVVNCSKIIMQLIDNFPPSVLERPQLLAAFQDKVLALVQKYKEECPLFLILYHALYNMMLNIDNDGSAFYMDKLDRVVGNFILDVSFFKDNKRYFGKQNGLLQTCMKFADLQALGYLIEQNPSVSDVVDCVCSWNFNDISGLKGKDAEQSINKIFDFVINKMGEDNVTQKLGKILSQVGGALNDLERKRNTVAHHTSGIYHNTQTNYDRSEYELRSRSLKELPKNEKFVVYVFGKVLCCYMLSLRTWNEEMGEVPSQYLSLLQFDWWTDVYKKLDNTQARNMNDNDENTEIVDKFLKNFTTYMQNMKEDDKEKLVKSKDFLDQDTVPQKMVNIIIDTIQTFVVNYLSRRRIYTYTYGFEKVLKEILIRKFPGGVTHTHLLATVADSTNYFPWEGIFDLDGFKDNRAVKDAKGCLQETFADVKNRQVTLGLLQKLMDENNMFNPRFSFLITKAVRGPGSSVEQMKNTLTDVGVEYEQFQLVLMNSKLLIQEFGQNKGIHVDTKVPQLKDFKSKKINQLWTRTASKKVQILSQSKFGDLSEEQIGSLRHIKVIQGCKLYKQLILRQFNGIDVGGCDLENDILTEVVLKAFDPAFSRLLNIIDGIRSEMILQKDIKNIFGRTTFPIFSDVRQDLLHICHNLQDVLGDRITDNTFKKLEIILSDLNTAFECLDSLKKTLKIENAWKNVEKLRKMVCKTDWNQPLSNIDATLDLTFFFKIRDTKDLVKGFAQSEAFINWIKEIAKDEKDITTFIDLANTLEDPARADRLSGLHKIILAIRPLIFDIKGDGKFEDFQKAFNKMYDTVKGDAQITSRLKDVTENLQWFKEMQDLQTDTTKSSISQVDTIKTSGRFIIGSHSKRTELVDFFEEQKIEALMKVEIVFETGENRTLQYKDLKELNDKLVLISGQQNDQDKVNIFTEVFGKLRQMCDTYKELNECGHVDYQDWEKYYFFDEPAETLKAVTEKYKNMQCQLEYEKTIIEERIRKYVPLTNFTHLQLLYLRIKLSCYKEDQPPAYYRETLILLQAINPEITIHEVRKQIYRQDNRDEMLSIDQLGELLVWLHWPQGGDTTPLQDYLRDGSITLLKVNGRDVFRCVLSLFMRAKRNPTAEEVLCCTSETNEEQISIFLRQAIFANNFRLINCLVSPEKLTYQRNKHFIEEYERLTKNNINSQPAFFLVVITVETVPCEIASTFVSNQKQFPLGSPNQVKEFTVSQILKNDSCVCDPERLSGRLVQSTASGNGKTRKAEILLADNDTTYSYRCIPIHKQNCDRNIIVKEFLSQDENTKSFKKMMYLVDVSPSVFEGADIFIFELLILKKITDSAGRVFRPFSGDYILVEGLFTCPTFIGRFPIDFCSFLPVFDCLSPRQSLDIYRTGQQTPSNQVLLVARQFRSEKWQRVYQYLSHYHDHGGSMEGFKFSYNTYLSGVKHEQRCIGTFLAYVKIEDPSWRELDNFVRFLNTQLLCYEKSPFTQGLLAPELGSQFNTFVVKFMVKMSEEFATRSLNISEGADVLDNHRLEKLWDKTFHPYLFFNEDGDTFTFIGFKIKAPGNLVDVVTDVIKEENFMNQDLLGRLRGQGVSFNNTFADYTSELLMDKLSYVLQLKTDSVQRAPDYQLTLDNTVKILAIHMRMRSNIPVVIMGETGCGKTRLISFMCDIVKQSVLSKFEEANRPQNVENLITLRVHGGITTEKICSVIKAAEVQAVINKDIDDKFETIVFFDEANATSEIDLIREIMCNHTINGRRINSSIRFIAAVNPYRKHTQDMIDLLKKAGLGYRTNDNDVFDRIGDIPLREVVYRVHPLPPSLKPLIWDFGSMDNETEKTYIKLIIQSKLADLSLNESYISALIEIISGCQDILRRRSDQCSFVSLRDVNRFIEVFRWFLNIAPVFAELSRAQVEHGNLHRMDTTDIPTVVLAAINAIGACYYVRISARDEYLQAVAKYFRKPFPTLRWTEIRAIIACTQKVLLYEMLHNSGVTFQEDVAENEALRENIFMMVVCIELNIPLFIVGHPGSSKSLAKLIVKACMSGLSSNSTLFDHLCQIHMTSFQCSPQSEAGGIERLFEAAEKFISDEDNNQARRVMPVVVLDEIGLAEDSKKMPLKALHSLLENNGLSDRTKIGFIGISNWALDPAKMNRGLYVTRQVPDLDELKVTAIQICKSEMRERLERQLYKVAEVYMEIYKAFSETDTKSYIGLRDFYCLVKHLCRTAEDKQSGLTDGDVMNSVYRNFGGICPDANSKVLQKFGHHFTIENALKPKTLNMIRENLRARTLKSGSRYLLIVTPTLETTIDTIYQELNRISENKGDKRTPQIKFNSDFPDDADYTKVCKAINDVKNSIERGDDMLLIDMEMIYESLYDVLNQYYKEWQGNKYVEIGLESHRVNCRVHEKTKIILLARPEQAVKFPIPLLNRMEKHYFTLRESMSLTELDVVKNLEAWVDKLTTSRSGALSDYSTNETFIGYHQDTTPSIVQTEWKRLQTKRNETRQLHEATNYIPHLLKLCENKLLRTVSYDGLVRFSLSDNEEYRAVWDTYYSGSIQDVIQDLKCFINDTNKKGRATNISTSTVITTFSHLPAKKNLPLPKSDGSYTFNVEEFGSQRSFETAVAPYFRDDTKWLVILVPARWHRLLSYMRFHLQSQRTENTAVKHVIIVTQLLRNTEDRPTLFHSEVWDNIHIEDLGLPRTRPMSRVSDIWHRTIPRLFEDDILNMHDILRKYKEQVICEISNPFPHVDIGVMLEECLTSGYLQSRIKQALKESQQSLNSGGKNWIQLAATDRTRLSETTSFQNVLMLKVSESLTRVAAIIVSDIDRDGNAALRAQTHLTELWDRMLEVLPSSSWSSAESKPELGSLRKVQHNFVCEDKRVNNEFPFSWVVKEWIDEKSRGIYILADDDEDLEDNFLNELNKTPVYQVLDVASENQELRQELNNRYLTDYINMSYASHNPIEMQIARRILEVSLRGDYLDYLDKHIAECAVLIHILHHKKGVDLKLGALDKAFTVYYQEISQNLGCFEDVIDSEDPLYDLCTILLQQIESSLDNIKKTNSFTIPVKDILRIYQQTDVTKYETLLSGWDRVRFKNLNYEFLQRLSHRIPEFNRNVYYAATEQIVDNRSIQEGLQDVIDSLYEMIVTRVEEMNLTENIPIERMWECSVRGSDCSYMYDQVITPCYHVMCRDCYSNIQGNCPICRVDLFEDTSNVPEDLEYLIEFMTDSVGEAVKFLSQVLVTFLCEQNLLPDVLNTLSTLGKGRVRENRILRAVHPDKLEALQTLIFTIFIKKQMETANNGYVQCISDACHVTEDDSINVQILAKFTTITQDVHTFRLDTTTEFIERYNILFIEDHIGPEYVQSTIMIVSGLRQMLKDLVTDVLYVLDNNGAGISGRLAVLRDSVRQLDPTHAYTLKLFFMKQIFKERGVAVLPLVVENAVLRWISPVQNVAAAEPDLFALLGGSYTALRNHLAVCSRTNNIDDISDEVDQNTCLPIQTIAATYYVLRNTQIPNNVLNVMREHLNETRAVQCFNALCCGGDVNTGVLCGLDMGMLGRFRNPVTLLYLILQIHCKHPFIKLLENIRMYPEQSDNKFLPGMRDNTLAEFVGNLGDGGRKYKWYRCQNGHAYAINNCGQPMELGTCICGAAIGGQNHQFHNQQYGAELTNANVNNMGFNEKGYNLLPPGVRPLADTERKLQPLLLNIVRWCVHATYLLAETTEQYKDRLFQLGTSDLQQFLVRNMERDLEGIRQHLQVGPDECHMFLMAILVIFAKSTDNVNFTCANKQERENVENAIINTVQPVLENPGGVIHDAQVLIVNDLNVATDPLIKQLYEFEDPPEALSSRVPHSSIELWTNTHTLNMDMFCNTFSNTLKSDTQDQYPVTRAFIEIRDKIHLLQLLPKIIEFHKRLISRYSYKFSLEEARNKPIGEVVRGDHVLEEGLDAWCLAWKELGVQDTRFAVPEAYRDKPDIYADEPLSLFLPEPVAREGICCLHLMDGLISLHNKFLKHTKKKEVKLCDRFLPINYEQERSLMFLLYSHSLQLVGKHREVRFSYNVFETYLLDEVLGGVHPISDAIKQFEDENIKMMYREDITWLDLCNKLNDKEPQQRIPSTIKLEFNDIRSASEAKNAFAIAIGYIRNGLGSGPGLDAEDLVGFMERIRSMDDSGGFTIPKSLQKCHVLDAWYTAYYYKSLRSTQNPFANLEANTATTLPPGIAGLAEWFADCNQKIVKIWLMEFHRFLIDWTVLKPPGSDLTGMEMDECYDFYAEDALLTRSVDEAPPLTPLPGNLLYENCVAFWLRLKEASMKV